MKTSRTLFALCLAVMLSGCGGMLKGRQAADQGRAEFHRLYNEGKLREIYAASHARLKTASKEQDFLDFVGAVHKKLGNVTQTSNNGFNLRSHNLNTTVVLTQNTTFEHGTGTETFTFQMEGEKAVLAGYFINSKELILK